MSMRKYITSILFTLLTVAAFAQTSVFSGLKVLGDSTTNMGDGKFWYNASSDKFRGRVNGATVTLYPQSGSGTGVTDGDKGDVTVSGTGATWTVDNAAITYAKFQNLTGLSVFGRSANSSGVGADITAGSDGNILYRNGTSLAFGSPPAASVANTAAGTIAATNVQTVLNELDTEKASLTGTETLTNKRLTARVQAVTSSATVTPNADSDDAVKVTAQAAGLTLANPSGTPTAMQAMLIRIKDNGTARSISYGSQYRGIGVVLPTTTVISKIMYLGLVWNSDDSKWDVIGYSLEP